MADHQHMQIIIRSAGTANPQLKGPEKRGKGEIEEREKHLHSGTAAENIVC